MGRVKKIVEQAGAELCQAQYLLELVKLCFGLQKLIYTSSVPSLKIDCLVRTGTITADIFIVPVHMLLVQMFNGRMSHGQMLHGQMLRGHIFLGHLVLGHFSTVKEGSTNFKCPPWYFCKLPRVAGWVAGWVAGLNPIS